MNPQLIIAALIAAAGFCSAWKIQDWRMDAKEKDYVEQALFDQRLAATAAIRRTEAVITATNAATVRATALRRDADASRDALDGLRKQSDLAVQDARTSHAACTVTATAQAVVLNQCAGEYQALARIADAHTSDITTLMEAWPKLKFETTLKE